MLGDAVEGNYCNKGTWLPGTIAAVNADGSFNVDYEDGTKEVRLTTSLIRPKDELERLRKILIGDGETSDGGYNGNKPWWRPLPPAELACGHGALHHQECLNELRRQGVARPCFTCREAARQRFAEPLSHI